MNIIKFLLPFVAFANASTNFTTTLPITAYEITSQNMNILTYKPQIDEEIVPYEDNVLYSTEIAYNAELAVWEAFGHDAPTMLAIAECESGKNQSAVSHTDDYGYFQIHAPIWDKLATQLGLDYKNSIADNIEMARVIHNIQGKSAWVCAKLLGITK